MQYFRTFTLKDGSTCTIRSGNEEDGQALLDLYIATHTQTDYLLTYPEETSFTAEQEAEYLRLKTESPDEAELIAEVDGKPAASAGISCVSRRLKTKHRAELGIAVDEAYKGLGIGRALTKACIECAEKAGYLQIELEAVADNTAAISLYTKEGFREYGRNPKGFRTRSGEWQELVLMFRELNSSEE
ncbi:MAG: GNAT family N-acetyltransferase [Solobacterium sp.]|nr:GNAT family N-acetyltransferase [Solobacterium sp.]